MANCIVNHQERQLRYSQIDIEIATHVEVIRKLYTRRNMLSPLCSFPAEVLSEIFTFCVPLSDFVRIRSRQLLDLTHVCRRWREIALDFPRLWSSVDVGVLSKQLVLAMLERARESPIILEVFVAPTDHSRDLGCADDLELTNDLELLKTVFSRLHQICELSVDFPPSYARTLAEYLSSSTPILQELTLVAEPPVLVPLSQPLPDSMPRLDVLTLTSCAFPWDSPIYGRLTQLHLACLLDDLSPTPEELWITLQSATSLEVLTVDWCFGQLDAQPAAWDTPKLLDLPRIKYIRMDEAFLSYVNFFSRVRIPPYAHLSISSLLAVEDTEFTPPDFPPISPDFLSIHRAEQGISCNTLQIKLDKISFECSIHDGSLDHEYKCNHGDSIWDKCRVFLDHKIAYEGGETIPISPFRSLCYNSPLFSIHTAELIVTQDYLGDIPWCDIFIALPRMQCLRATLTSTILRQMFETLNPRSGALHVSQLREMSLKGGGNPRNPKRLGECIADALEQRSLVGTVLDKLTGKGIYLPEPYFSKVECVVKDIKGFSGIDSYAV
ncbi:hypothetical protein CONPUDRAFT_147961 [Coniophora puteana RWD-64-598 SS2]|uniref:F-box domain-containing protein n=1 Tax=Coniophora puteana (strain RWD-64-598) TaxID=741705 RepID=R7SE15_CONPW|nr:uncharacterized protein CONPUDRAFT_147961 [Coniophora puteana RWD-64-598 SS2]EIW73992.1 hypothetical protein CONPUDRAFT_147961 [Coniophora puteana RWD-64-598 SS2]